MARLNPSFKVEGKEYEIIRTRALECEYEKIREKNKLTDEQVSLSNDYAKLVLEFEEIAERFRQAKEEYYEDVLNNDKKAKFKAFKELSDEKFEEIKNFEINNKSFSMNELQKMAYKNGVELLVFGLVEQCNLTREDAISVWDKFVEYFGVDYSKDWIAAMVQVLFEREEEDEDPFMKQAKAKAKQKMEQRKGLSKVKK